METTLRKVSDFIEQNYINPEMGKRIAKDIRDLISKDDIIWSRYLITSNLRKLIYRVNCLLSIADDWHFNISIYRPIEKSMPRNGIVKFTKNYIYITSFEDLYNTVVWRSYERFFAEASEEITIDLRWCRGGSPETALFLLSHLFDTGTILYKSSNRYGKKTIYKAYDRCEYNNDGNFAEVKKYKGKVNVMINADTYSAGELVAAVIQNLNRGTIYGARSSGDANVMIYTIIDNLQVNLSILYIYTPDGKTWEGTGILPDYDPTSSEFVKLVYHGDMVQ